LLQVDTQQLQNSYKKCYAYNIKVWPQCQAFHFKFFNKFRIFVILCIIRHFIM